MSKIRQSIRDDWEEFKIYPLECLTNIDPTRYRVSPEGRVVRGEWYGDKAGLPLKVCYDKRLKQTYCNVKDIYDKTVRLYCDNLITYHKNYVKR
jgi:hypothetical protein